MAQNGLPSVNRQVPLQTLVEYISICCEMEKNILQQEYLIQSLNNEKSRLGIPKTISQPGRWNERDLSEGKQYLAGGILMIVAGAICAVIAVFAFFTSVLAAIFISSICGMACAGCIKIAMRAFHEYDNATRMYQEQQHRKELYFQKVQKYKSDVEAEKRRMQYEKEQIRYIDIQIRLIEGKLARSREAMSAIYSVNIIYVNYRSLPALTSFYDYFMAGICTELGGHDGAYNKYDMERRMDHVITQLDVVIQNLEMIRNNQHMLYMEMSALRQTNERMLQSINSMRKEYAATSMQLMDSLNGINNNISSVGQQVMIGNISNAANQLANQKYLRQISNNADLINHNAELTRKEAEFMRRKMFY